MADGAAGVCALASSTRGSFFPSVLLVGFAAETDDIEKNALKKLKDKNIDMIVVNDLLRSGSGFGVDTNSVVIFDRSGKREELPSMPKSQMARCIMSSVLELIKQRTA